MAQTLVLQSADCRPVEPVPGAERGADALEPVWPGYRSEAFAEDLAGFEAPAPVRRPRRTRAVLLSAVPLCAALAGAVLCVVTSHA
jgi:hypothetical protein